MKILQFERESLTPQKSTIDPVQVLVFMEMRAQAVALSICKNLAGFVHQKLFTVSETREASDQNQERYIQVEWNAILHFQLQTGIRSHNEVPVWPQATC